MHDKTINETYFIDVAIPNSHNLQREYGLYTTISPIHNGYYTIQFTRKFKTA